MERKWRSWTSANERMRGMKARWGVFEPTVQINDSRLLLKNCIPTKDNVTSWNNNQDWCG